MVKSRHKIDTFLNHQLDFAVVEIHSMFNGLDAGIYTITKAFAAKSMTRDSVPFLVSFINDGVHFLRGKGWWDDHLPVRSEGKFISGIQLDPIGPMCDLFAHCFTRSPGGVHYLQRHWHWNLGRVAVHEKAT